MSYPELVVKCTRMNARRKKQTTTVKERVVLLILHWMRMTTMVKMRMTTMGEGDHDEDDHNSEGDHDEYDHNGEDDHDDDDDQNDRMRMATMMRTKKDADNYADRTTDTHDYCVCHQPYDPLRYMYM